MVMMESEQYRNASVDLNRAKWYEDRELYDFRKIFFLTKKTPKAAKIWRHIWDHSVDCFSLLGPCEVLQ